MLALRPLAAADLAAVAPWFDDDETRHWLGGRSWPAKGLRLAGPGRHALLGLMGSDPVGLLDVEISADRRAAFAIVVAPEQRRHGTGRALVEACIAAQLFADVAEWFAGVERGNVASQQLLLACGFVRMTDEDADGFSYFARRRAGWPDLPWRPYVEQRTKLVRERKVVAGC